MCRPRTDPEKEKAIWRFYCQVRRAGGKVRHKMEVYCREAGIGVATAWRVVRKRKRVSN